MKHASSTGLFALVFAFLCTLPSVAHAQGAGIEWNRLNQEVMELYRVCGDGAIACIERVSWAMVATSYRMFL